MYFKICILVLLVAILSVEAVEKKKVTKKKAYYHVKSRQCPEQRSRLKKIQRRFNRIVVARYNSGENDCFKDILTKNPKVMIQSFPTADGKQQSVALTTTLLQNFRTANITKIAMTIDEATQVSLGRAVARGMILEVQPDDTLKGNTRFLAILKKPGRGRWFIDRLAVNTFPLA